MPPAILERVRPLLYSFTLVGLYLACSSNDRPPRFRPHEPEPDGGTGGISIEGGPDGPPPADAPGLCGNLIIPVVFERTNLYFVLDRSGSMSEPLAASGRDKYLATRLAIREVLHFIGHRVRYGAAVFPSGTTADSCAPGQEVFATVPGDPVTFAEQGMNGPVLQSFLITLARYQPVGGTPTAPTLRELIPTITSLGGPTSVILATDGAPNCNTGLSCSTAQCQLNIEESSVDGIACTPSFNCCDPALVVQGNYYCVDSDASEAAVTELAQAGIKTYVIGMPGTALYTSLLNRLAELGGTARPLTPFYYAANDALALGQALKEIGTAVSVSCEITLDQAPPEPTRVNVYLDTALVPSDEVDGWTWTGEKSLELRGAACARLKSGDVLQVQVVAGCPTVTPN
jgi:hypothetical protein